MDLEELPTRAGRVPGALAGGGGHGGGELHAGNFNDVLGIAHGMRIGVTGFK